MSSLYVTEDGTNIQFVNQRIIVNGKLEKRTIPIETLDSIEIFGRVQISSKAINECLERNIPVSFHMKSGKYMGSLMPTGYTNTQRQRLQFRATEDNTFCIAVAKKIVSAKIHNQAVLLRRYSRNNKYNANDEIYKVLRSEEKIERCNEIEEIIGYEGYAARIYFQALSKLVDPEFSFQGRSRRPPEDEFNAMISFGYSLLFDEIYSKVEKRGLNAFFSFVHKEKQKHPALVSDLMEEWRAIIVDSVVMSLISHHEIKKSNFYRPLDGEGVYIDKEGRKIFINKLQQKMKTEIKYLNYIDYPVSFRRGIDLQVMQLVKAIELNDSDIYEPVRIR